jgi:hypothetical protein
VPLTCLAYLVIMFSRVKLRSFVPAWLVVMNFIFLFALLFYIFYLDDPYYHQ